MTGRVTELNSPLANMLSAPAGASSKNGAVQSFQKVMDETGSKSGTPQTNVSSDTDTDAGRKTSLSGTSANAAKVKEKTAAEDVSANDGVREEDVAAKGVVTESGELEDQVTTAAEAAAAAIMQLLNVTAEQLTAAMEQLGLQDTDLLSTDSLTLLVAELAGDGDVSSLLMDNGLYGQLKQVTAAVETIQTELADELGITPKELDAALKMYAETKKPQDVKLIVQEQTGAEVQEDAPELIVRDETKNNAELRETNGQEAPMTGQQRTDDTAKTQDQTSDESKQQTGEHAQTFRQNTGTVQNETTVSESQNVPHADTEEIMRQITEQIKITLRPGNSIMEMELNPASLGRVSVHIEARSGVITAQFAAQNEAVKEAIESQSVQLRETLENQGIKVDAVEVTIASHEFERNLHQNSDGKEEREKKAEAVSKKKIRLNLMEEEPEELSEEEELAKKIMIENGNSIDYTA